MNKRDQAEAYRMLMGDEALLRQVFEAESRYPCCGAYRATGHHALCRHHPYVKAKRAAGIVSEKRIG